MRLRKEYLYRKSLEGKEKDAFERKQRIKDAMAGESWLVPMHAPAQVYVTFALSTAGKSLPTESRKEAASLLHEIEMEDDAHAAPKVCPSHSCRTFLRFTHVSVYSDSHGRRVWQCWLSRPSHLHYHS
jgi:hypothetical protein